MQRIVVLLGATVGGAVGWWLGAFVGIMTAFFVSTILSGVGMYLGIRISRAYLP